MWTCKKWKKEEKNLLGGIQTHNLLIVMCSAKPAALKLLQVIIVIYTNVMF